MLGSTVQFTADILSAGYVTGRGIVALVAQNQLPTSEQFVSNSHFLLLRHKFQQLVSRISIVPGLGKVRERWVDYP